MSFDHFIKNINESEYPLNKDINEMILCKAFQKIKEEEHRQAFSIQKNKFRLVSIRNATAACLALLLIYIFLSSSPVHALYQKIFSFIPGIGVIRSETEDSIIQSALNEPVRVSDDNAFLEIKSAYIVNNRLTVTISTNIGTGHIRNMQDKKEILQYVSGETMPGIYLLYNGQKVKLTGYSAAGPSLETKIYTINGSFYLEDNTPADTVFQITMDGFDKFVDFQLSLVKNGITPESMGSTLTVHDIVIFANTDRNEDILSVTLSTVAPKIYRNLRFYLFDFEKELFGDCIYLLDQEGIQYHPDDDLRLLNNSGIHTFYFRIPSDREVIKIVIPQILYNRHNDAEIKINMPKMDSPIALQKELDLGESSLLLNNASMVPKHDPILPDEFYQYDCLKLDYHSIYPMGSIEKILRIIPNIHVPDGLTGYKRPSSAVNSELCPLEKNEGYTLINFEDMDKSKKIMITLDIEQAVMGPFELYIKD